MNEHSSDLALAAAALRDGAATVRLAGRSQLELSGDDRAPFLHVLTTNHIKQLAAWQGCETFLCNTQGKTIGHGFVFCFPDCLVLETTPGQAPGLLQHLDRYLFREKVVLRDRSDEWTETALAGSGSVPLLRQLGVAAIPAQRCAHVATRIGAVDVSLRRVDFVAGDCFVLSAPSSQAAELDGALAGAGAVTIGPQAWDVARIEAGTPLFDVDITPDNLPQEVARNEQAINFVKGCYLGQETVARLDALGHVNRLLVRLRLPGQSPPPPGSELVKDGKTVGRVTSSAWSESLQSVVALAYVRRELATPDSTGWVQWSG